VRFANPSGATLTFRASTGADVAVETDLTPVTGVNYVEVPVGVDSFSLWASGEELVRTEVLLTADAHYSVAALGVNDEDPLLHVNTDDTTGLSASQTRFTVINAEPGAHVHGWMSEWDPTLDGFPASTPFTLPFGGSTTVVAEQPVNPVQLELRWPLGRDEHLLIDWDVADYLQANPGDLTTAYVAYDGASCTIYNAAAYDCTPTITGQLADGSLVTVDGSFGSSFIDGSPGNAKLRFANIGFVGPIHFRSESNADGDADWGSHNPQTSADYAPAPAGWHTLFAEVGGVVVAESSLWHVEADKMYTITVLGAGTPDARLHLQPDDDAGLAADETRVNLVNAQPGVHALEGWLGTWDDTTSSYPVSHTFTLAYGEVWSEALVEATAPVQLELLWDTVGGMPLIADWSAAAYTQNNVGGVTDAYVWYFGACSTLTDCVPRATAIGPNDAGDGFEVYSVAGTWGYAL
jgi:hypothetical protein